MGKVDLALERELKRIERDLVLAPGEIVCAVELAVEDAFPGALVLSTERVLFHSTRLFARKKRVISIPLQDVGAVEVSMRRWIVRRRGVLTVARRDQPGTSVEFERIRSVGRAEEFARSIERQRSLLQADPQT